MPGRKAYDPGKDHEALFDVKPAPRSKAPTSRSTPSVTRGRCPDCAAEKAIGIVRQGSHFVWRHHTKRTLSGAVMECRATGVPICQAKPKPEQGVPTPTCPCGGRNHA